MKKTSIEVFDNDIYFMEVLKDYLVINDNYEGLIFLDFNFNLVKKIYWEETLIIYSSFICGNNLLLFCPDNKCMIYIDTERMLYHNNDLDDYEDVIFSNLYQWDSESELFLVTIRGEILRIDLENYVIQEDKMNVNTSFLEVYNKLQFLNVVKLYPARSEAIIQNDDRTICLLNYETDTCLIRNLKSKTAHDWESYDGYLVCIGEKEVVIAQNGNRKIYPSNKSAIFLRGKLTMIQGCIYLFLLVGNQSDAKNNIIIRYVLHCE